LRKVPVVWTTGIGGTGVSVFYTDFAVDATVEITAFFNGIKSLFSDVVSWSIPNAGDIISDATGQITGAWVGGTTGSVSGTAHSPYVAGTGAFVRWITNGVSGGRRVRGRTFLVPLLASGFQDDGTILGSYQTTMQTAANTLAATGKLQVFHRPTTIVAANGAAFPVTGATVPDKVTSLKTRRT
jgi:hypothetical protein